MKRILLIFLLACQFVSHGQVFNNEWIDYNKTYYKFKVGRDGLYRIPQTVLAAAGLAAAPAEQFQLWRNGVQVPIYTSVATGALPANGYIEFWGKMNDGKADRELYRNSSFQLNDRWSLSTDTASYFLTVNPVTANNFRLQPATNNVAGNTLPAEPYFMYTLGRYYKDRINPGYAVNVGEYLYSSSYDRGEGWSSTEVPKDGTLTASFPNLYVYASGPQAKFKLNASGNVINQRRYRVNINGDSVLGNAVDFFNMASDSANFALTTLSSGTANVTITNITSCTPTNCPSSDRMVVHQFEITYPRQFVFDGSANFEFNLPASAVGNYLQITNFNYGSTPPVLYDLTNGQRYLADMSGAPALRFVLQPSASDRSLVLVSQEAANTSAIASLQVRNFVNYGAAANQGDYLIISSQLLMNGSGGSNPVNDYRIYRSSAAGGGYNARIYLVDEITDQFGFGIKKFPAAIRNFVRFARLSFAVTPKFVFLLGKGVNYMDQRSYESGSAAQQDNLERLNLVPTYGWPASDVLMTSDPGSSIPKVPIGRLSAISPQEVTLYLNKVKEYEQAQAFTSPAISDKAWMKNVVHIIGAHEDGLYTTLKNSMDNFKAIISDTLYGARVSLFAKASSSSIEQLNNGYLNTLFSDGISLITYFGHSSASTLEFNLDDPNNYQNQGKYPVFIGLGCNAGNFYNYNTVRFITNETISEKYVLAANRGTIGFVASSHFGIVHYLDIWNTENYKNLTSRMYGKSVGEIIRKTAEDVFSQTTQEDFYARSNVEETQFHGDPAIVMNLQPKPDYAIEDPMVKLIPGFVSVADGSFKVEARVMNLGKAPARNIVVEVKRQFPDQSVSVVARDTIPGIRFMDSLVFTIDIDPIHDKGLNKITVTVDPQNEVAEMFETNNSVTKDVMIYEDEARPVYPYHLSIINKPSIKLLASTANPFSSLKTYRMEMDTTELFNSPAKIIKTINATGGLLEFDPGITFTNNQVYYWRVGTVPANGPITWNTTSFVYLANSALGFNQSHVYQHFKSTYDGLILDSVTRKLDFGSITSDLFVRNGVFPTAASQSVDFSVSVNGDPYVRSVCGVGNIMFHVFDRKTFKPWQNAPVGQPGLYGSDPTCGATRIYNFQFNLLDTNKRRKIVEFMDMIPDGDYIVVKNTSGTDFASNTYASTWMGDTSYLGSGNSMYHRLKQAGFTTIDSFNQPRSFIFIYQKGNPNYQPKQTFSQGIYDKITLFAECQTSDTIGFVRSPVFGPAKAWKELRWGGATDATPGDNPRIAVLGLNVNGNVDTLMNQIGLTQPVVDISGINPAVYPNLQLVMRNTDTVFNTPYQLNYWRLTYDPAPEGAVTPGLYFSMKDTVDVAEPLLFRMAFKNISEAAFPDSLQVRAVVTDRNNIQHVLPIWKQRALPVNDTVHIRYPVDTRQLVGSNSIYVEVNPNNAQPEQYHFNNNFFRSFYVRPDTLNPLLDVTFDNVRILNHDIVSSRPNIMIKLKDEAKWFLLEDTATVNVQVRFPDNSLRTYHFDNNTMQFIPAQQAPNSDNTATVNLKPMFDQDGEYELLVSGKDMSQNRAGAMQYRVAFQVWNKPMISNMLNYPNPFTTSTAFVFTLTGSEVPQNIRIQILTVTGKIVREINKDELGPIHIGRNITEFKWDGTDQYGQKLGNGVYLYRVITNLNGKSLDKFTDGSEQTDKFFNKGYGKMYLMR